MCASGAPKPRNRLPVLLTFSINKHDNDDDDDASGSLGLYKLTPGQFISVILNQSRTTKVEAAACYGSNVQDRTRESIPHDSAAAVTASTSHFEILIFSVFVDSAVYRTTKLRRGMEASKAFKLHEENTTRHYGHT